MDVWNLTVGALARLKQKIQNLSSRLMPDYFDLVQDCKNREGKALRGFAALGNFGII